MGFLSRLRGGGSGGGDRCPCGRFGKPGAHDGVCAWREGRVGRGGGLSSGGGGVSVPVRPSGPSGSSGSSGVSGVYDRLSLSVSSGPSVPSGSSGSSGSSGFGGGLVVGDDGLVRAADGRGYDVSPLPKPYRGGGSGVFRPYSIHDEVVREGNVVGGGCASCGVEW